MFYKGQFIARIPNDKDAQVKIEQYKNIHGQLRLCGRHKDRKGAMQAVGLTLNNHGDLPYRLGTEIVIYRNENGMTYRQFKSLEVGDMVETVKGRKFGEKIKLGIVSEKRGKNKIKIVIEGNAYWTTRQHLTLYEYDKK